VWQRFEIHRTPTLKKPVLLVSLSTSIPQYQAMYSQARELANYMLKKMKFDAIASLYSSALPPEVEVREDGTVSLTVIRFYLSRGEKDLVLLAGDSSPLDDQYQFTDAVLEYARKLGVKEMYSVGPRWTEAPAYPSQAPAVLGFASDSVGVEDLRSNGVELIKEEPAPFFASMVVGMAGDYGMRGYKVSVNHGEPMPHTRSVQKMLEVLSKMIGFEIDLAELQPATEASPNLRTDRSGVYQ
jgi:proteasome assembly chaperone (PAC2) family protein